MKTLVGASADLYEESKDLMVLAPQVEEDRLTRFLRYYFAIFFIVSIASAHLQSYDVHHLADQGTGRFTKGTQVFGILLRSSFKDSGCHHQSDISCGATFWSDL